MRSSFKDYARGILKNPRHRNAVKIGTTAGMLCGLSTLLIGGGALPALIVATAGTASNVALVEIMDTIWNGCAKAFKRPKRTPAHRNSPAPIP